MKNDRLMRGVVAQRWLDMVVLRALQTATQTGPISLARRRRVGRRGRGGDEGCDGSARRPEIMIMQRVIFHHFPRRVLSVPAETHFVSLNVDASRSCTVHGMNKHVRF